MSAGKISLNLGVFSRRKMLDFSSTILVLPAFALGVAAGQQQQKKKSPPKKAAPPARPVRRQNAPDGELVEASYERDGSLVKMRLNRSAVKNQYSVELQVTEQGKTVLQVKTLLDKQEPTLGRVTFTAEGQRFFYQIVIDGRDIPVAEGLPREAKAGVLIRHSGRNFDGRFDVRQWSVQDLDQAPRLDAVLPEELKITLEPFKDSLVVMVRRYEIQSQGAFSSEGKKPPDRFWTSEKCKMVCWSLGNVGTAISCFAGVAIGCLVAVAAFGAASSFCDSRCSA